MDRPQLWHGADGLTPGPQRRGATPFDVVRGGVIALVVFALLGSGELVATATGLEVGPTRSIVLPVTRGIDRVANLFSLNRPADFVSSSVLGRDVNGGEDFEFPTSTEPPTQVTTTTAPPRTITELTPLKVGVFGDSMAADFGARLALDLGDDPFFDILSDGRPSTGLARLDFFHWPQELSTSLDGLDVVVVFFGGNDDQALTDAAGDVVAATPSTPEWIAEYRRRVGGVMDLATESTRRLVWVAMPRVEPEKLSRAAVTINAIIDEEASSRPAVEVLQIEDLLDPGGSYSTFREIDGETVRCRRSDGVHLTLDCVGLVSDAIDARLRDMFSIGEPPTRVEPDGTAPANATAPESSDETPNSSTATNSDVTTLGG